jgi:hypothetical protein
MNHITKGSIAQGQDVYCNSEVTLERKHTKEVIGIHDVLRERSAKETKRLRRKWRYNPQTRPKSE